MTDWVRRHIAVLAVAAAAIVLIALAAWAIAADRPPSTGPAAAPIRTTSAGPPGPTPSSTPESAPAPSAAPDCAAVTVAGLSLDERVGQVLMVGAPVNDPRAMTATVARYHLGGVFLAGRSTRRAAALRADITALRTAAGESSLLVALDQEGGSVQTLRGLDFPALPSASRLGERSAVIVRAETADAAKRLADIGVTVNLAPVADTVPAALGERNPPIGFFHRQYGSDPDRVAADIRTVVTAYQQAGVLTTIKHFPGLGRVLANTDTSATAVDATASAGDSYLHPFRVGIEAGTGAVMVSSASYPRLDRSSIAAFSRPIITGLLRERLGFTGLVMSDDLGAAAAARSVGVGERAVRFVRAGGDLVLTVRSQDAGPMSAALRSAAGRSPEFAARVTDAATHVVRAKYRAGLLTCPGPG